MNIKFEWVQVPTDHGHEAHNCWLGHVFIGQVFLLDGGYAPIFGEHFLGKRVPALDEAKAFVEEQARAWLAEVTA